MDSGNGFSRRSLLKAFATLPFLGFLGYGTHKKISLVEERKELLRASYDRLGFDTKPPVVVNHRIVNNNKLRLGVIGLGIRGKQLMKALGFMHPSDLSAMKKREEQGNAYTGYSDYLAQADLNIEIHGVCDLFDVFAERGTIIGSNQKKLTTEAFADTKITTKRYTHYLDLVNDPLIDAVVVVTSDNWHVPIAIAAARAGKHVYLEKPLSRTLEECFEIESVMEETGVVFQLGHQGRQTDTFVKAKELISKGVLGDVKLIQTSTNRNTPNGAWVYPIHPKAGQDNIDWEQFQKNTTKHGFSLERFFRWRCWWEYGTGLSGDLLTHEYDGVNQVMDLGIPHSCIASGGIYNFKDGRNVPDVFHVVCEYPEKDLTFMYSATQANSIHRGKLFMGTDGSMELGNKIDIFADRNSKKYREELKDGLFNTSDPIYTYLSGGSNDNIDALSSATAKYFAQRGLLYTHRGGRRVDTTYLHLKEWLDCIRSDRKTALSCGLKVAFEEGVVAQMAKLSYQEKTMVYWDADKRKVVKA